eukprot:tig00000944_g5933.t1
MRKRRNTGYSRKFNKTAAASRPRRTEVGPQDAALDDLLHQISPAIETYSGRQRLLMDVSKALQAAFPTCTVHTYGSTFTGLDLDGSDIDMCVLFPFIPDPRCLLDAALPVLEAANVGQAYPIREARIPIIKIVDHHGYEADLCFNETSGLRNTQRIQKIAARTPMLKKLARLIKWWAACRMLPDSRQGGIGSYAWVVLAVFCLNQPHLRNSTSIYEVLTNFFLIYTSRPPRSVASVDQRRWILKTSKGWLRDDHPDALSIEDPNNPNVDLAWGISEYTDICLRAEFQRAFSILSGPAKSDPTAIYSVFAPPPIPAEPWADPEADPEAEAEEEAEAAEAAGPDALGPDASATEAPGPEEPRAEEPRREVPGSDAPGAQASSSDSSTSPEAGGGEGAGAPTGQAVETAPGDGAPAEAGAGAADSGNEAAGAAAEGRRRSASTVDEATEGGEGDESEAGGPHDWISSSGSEGGHARTSAPRPPAAGALALQPAGKKKGKKGGEEGAAGACLGPPLATSSSSCPGSAAHSDQSSSSSSSPQLRPRHPAEHPALKPRPRPADGPSPRGHGGSAPGAPAEGASPRSGTRTPRSSPKMNGSLGRGRGRERTRSRGASGAESVLLPEAASVALRARKEARTAIGPEPRRSPPAACLATLAAAEAPEPLPF